MPAVKLPSQPELMICVNTALVTHTVLDERSPSEASLAINLSGGQTISCKRNAHVSLEDLHHTNKTILRFINHPEGDL